MKKAYLLFMFIMPLSLAIQSCKPDKPATPDDNWPKEWYIPQEVLDYFYFNEGSYWVYENDKTNERDTLVLVKNGRGLTNATQQGERYEVAYTELVSKRDGFTYKYGINTQGSAGCIKNGSKWPCYIVSCNKYKVGSVLGESLSLILPFKKNYGGNADFSSQSSTITMLDTMSSIIVNAVTYQNVIKVNITNALVSNRKNINTFWSKRLGIIKRENLTDSETWNLVESNIF